MAANNEARFQVTGRTDKARPVTILAIDAGSDATLFFDFVTVQPRPCKFVYCQLTAIDLCLPEDVPTPRHLTAVRFTARESTCSVPIIDLAAPVWIDFLVDEDAPEQVYGVRVRIPAGLNCDGKRQRELGFVLAARDSDGANLVLASGLLAQR